MYTLQAKPATKQANNGTRKRFRGGVDEPAQPGTQPPSTPPVDEPLSEPLPVVEQSSTEASSEAPQVNELEAPPVNELEAPPVNELEAPPVNELEAPPVNELEAPPVNELEAPPVNEFGEPPAVDQSIPAQTEVFEEQPALAAVTGEGESAEIEAFRNMMGTSPEAQQVYLYMNTNISTEENRDKSYKREGVLHFTDSVSVGANQNTIMSLGSVIGNRGIETTTYDKLRNIALQKVGIILGETRRCYNTKIGFERNGETILVHIYGTVYSKKSEQPTV